MACGILVETEAPGAEVAVVFLSGRDPLGGKAPLGQRLVIRFFEQVGPFSLAGPGAEGDEAGSLAKEYMVSIGDKLEGRVGSAVKSAAGEACVDRDRSSCQDDPGACGRSSCC